MGDSLVVDWIYRLCIVTIQEYNAEVDICVLDMVGFYLILGMDLVSLYNEALNYFTMTITLSIPGIPLIVC